MRAARRFGLLLAALVVVGACSGGTAAVPPVSKADFDFVNRLTWGATPADIADYKRLGRDAWVDVQLAPKPRPLPAAVQASFDAMPLAATPYGEQVVDLNAKRFAGVHAATVEERKAIYGEFQRGTVAAREQSLARSFTRDLTSPDQLREQLTWFWFNQFNVRGNANVLTVMVSDYEENAIRAHATGKFCDLVNATLRHPAMLFYLNNADNFAGHINENYARELMELHTLGVGGGYSQQDVQTLAKVLTGVTVDTSKWPAPPSRAGYLRDGLFEFDPSRHDHSAKTLLGHKLTAKGFAEVEEATAILCAHPSTARRMATRLAQYFVADEPPQSLIDKMTATYASTGGDIAAIMKTMIASPEFTASLGTLYKDPQHFVLSAARLTLGGQPPVDTVMLARLLGSLEQGRFARLTPDGFPLTSANWNASGQLSTRFGIASLIGARGGAVFAPRLAAIPAPPDFKALQASGIYGELSPATAKVLGEARNAAEWNALYLSSPEFMRR